MTNKHIDKLWEWQCRF